MEGSRLVDSQRPWTATTIDKRWRKSRSREARMCGDRETAASASGGREEQCVRLQYVAQPLPMGHSSTFRQAAEGLAIVIMEVSGCCKSTIAALLVEALWAAASSKQMAIIPSQTKVSSKQKETSSTSSTSPFLQYRARSQGYVVYCVRVRFGGRKRPMPNCIICAKPKHQGITQLKFQRYKSLLLRRGLDASLADSGPLYEEKLTMTFF